MFSLLVQYSKLVTVLTGALPPLSCAIRRRPCSAMLMFLVAGLGWDLHLKPTPGAWDYGTGMRSLPSETKICPPAATVTASSVQEAVSLTAKVLATTSLAPFGIRPAATSTTAMEAALTSAAT